MQTKEQIYDDKISPLMTQVIALCKEHGIAMLANFAVPSAEDDGLQALTNLPDEKGSFPDNHVAALRCIRPPRPGPLMLKERHADGSLTMTAILG